jgi:hypothetical protein
VQKQQGKQISIDLFMNKSSCNMGARYGVYQHVLLDVFDSPAKCSNLAMFHGQSQHHPQQDAQIHIPDKAIRQQQGKKWMGTS